MLSTQCKIVLVRPRDPNNIGAAARAMKNFGLTELAVVAPHPPVWSEVVSAVNATDVIANARVVGSLIEAVADCTLVVGTTDCRRIESGRTIYIPADLSREVREAPHRLALVFGPEKHGLTNEDLSHCHRIVSIPTSPDCPSMNLGQAVAICCYELTRDQPLSVAARDPELTTAGEIEVALDLALDVLRHAGFVRSRKESDVALKLRRSLLRVNMTKQEVNTLCGALRKIKERLAGKRA